MSVQQLTKERHPSLSSTFSSCRNVNHCCIRCQVRLFSFQRMCMNIWRVVGAIDWWGASTADSVKS